jgi:hypothetical protein
MDAKSPYKKGLVINLSKPSNILLKNISLYPPVIFYRCKDGLPVKFPGSVANQNLVFSVDFFVYKVIYNYKQ